MGFGVGCILAFGLRDLRFVALFLELAVSLEGGVPKDCRADPGGRAGLVAGFLAGVLAGVPRTEERDGLYELTEGLRDPYVFPSPPELDPGPPLEPAE